MLDGSDDAGSQQKLFPGASQVDDMNSIRATLEDVLLHLVVDILGSKMSGGRQKLGHIRILEG